jgi:hypothetical protein
VPRREKVSSIVLHIAVAVSRMQWRWTVEKISFKDYQDIPPLGRTSPKKPLLSVGDVQYTVTDGLPAN